MEARELRIGNLVLFSETDTIFTVEEIMKTGLSVTNPEESTWIDLFQFQPIPLTEEWLLKFRFEMNANGFMGKGRLLYHKLYGWQILSQWVKDWVGVAPIQYVHQLQNLYYALTGEELTWK